MYLLLSKNANHFCLVEKVTTDVIVLLYHRILTSFICNLVHELNVCASPPPPPLGPKFMLKS